MNLVRRLLVALAIGLLVLPATLRAEDASDPFSGLASQSFEDIAAAITALAASGQAQASPTIVALQNEALFVTQDQMLLIKSGDDYLDARTGQKVADVVEDDLTNVRVNNAVRRAIAAATGGLDLVSPDPAIRLRAAGQVFTSRDPASLPLLATALAKETNASVRNVLLQARAAALLASNTGSEDEQVAAVAVLAARGDIEAKSLLGSLHGNPPAVLAKGAAAIVAIERLDRLWSLAQGLFYGLSLGSVLLLAAAGLAITFGVMGVINMAHGEMVMLGAYTTYVVQGVIAAVAPGLMGFSLMFAVPAAFLVSGLIGVLIERTLIRFLYGRPLETLLATWGLSLVLQQAVRSIFGSSNRDVTTPGWMSGSEAVLGLTITFNRLYIILFAVIVIGLLMAVLRYTSLGLRMRAVTQNRRMAAAMGIRTPWIDALTFGLGSGVAGMAGVALSQIDNVSPNLGQSYIIDSFMVVVFGGVGNLWGTVVSAMTLGIVNKFLEPLAGAVLGKIVVLVALILFIQRKPRGMFPLKGRAVEQ
jgi:urea transport system permease protein